MISRLTHSVIRHEHHCESCSEVVSVQMRERIEN